VWETRVLCTNARAGRAEGEIPVVGGAVPFVRVGRRVARRHHVRRTDTRYLVSGCRGNGRVTCSNKSRQSRTPTGNAPCARPW
jgi:hypothetical protein